SLRGRREQPRECLVPEPDLDDHGARVALVRLSGERIPERKPVMSAEDKELSRRDVIKLGAAATVAASLGVAHVEAQARTGGFLSESEFATLDELSELIIPSDAQSPGAREGKVAAFIDSQLAEAWDEKDRSDWRAGLGVVERVSQEMHSTPFMKA